MPLTVSETLLDGNGAAVVGAQVYCAASMRPLWVNQGSGAWAIADAGSYAVATTNASGVWTLTLPWPDHCDPTSVSFIITLPDGSQLAGRVPQGVSGPLTLKNLKDTYSWAAPAGTQQASVLQTVSGPAGPVGPTSYVLASTFGPKGDGVTDDTATLQAAINSLAPNGGTLLFDPGKTYLVSQLVLGNRVWLKGMGMHGTTIKQKANTTGDLIINHVSTNGTTDPNAEFCGVADLTLDGNKANQTAANNGINWSCNPLTTQGTSDDDAGTHQIVENVWVTNCKGSGCVGTGRGDGVYTNVHVSNCDVYAFNPGPDMTLDGCVSVLSGQEGFHLAQTNVRLHGCESWQSGRITASNGHGYRLTGGAIGAALASCDALDNQAAGYALDGGSSANVLTGCCADSNSLSGAGSYPGFSINGSNWNRLEGCISVDRTANPSQTQLYGVKVTGGAVGNQVDLMHVFTSGSISGVLDPASTLTGTGCGRTRWERWTW